MEMHACLAKRLLNISGLEMACATEAATTKTATGTEVRIAMFKRCKYRHLRPAIHAYTLRAGDKLRRYTPPLILFEAFGRLHGKWLLPGGQNTSARLRYLESTLLHLGGLSG